MGPKPFVPKATTTTDKQEEKVPSPFKPKTATPAPSGPKPFKPKAADPEPVVEEIIKAKKDLFAKFEQDYLLKNEEFEELNLDTENDLGEKLPKPFKPPVKAPREVGKPMFAGGVGENVEVEPYIKNHPLCQELSNADKARVRNLVNNANLQNTTYILNYGDSLKEKFVALVNDIVAETRTGQAAQVNGRMQELLAVVQGMNISTIAAPQKRGIFEKLLFQDNGPTVDETVQKFHKSIDDADTIIKDLQNKVPDLIQRADDLNETFKKNADNFTFLKLHIVAGKIIVEKNTNEILPQMQATAGTDLFKLQDVNYFKECIDRFDQNVNNIERIAQSVILNAPQIRSLQLASKDAAQRIKTLAQQTLPAWKTQYLVLCTLLLNTKETSLSKAMQSATFMKSQDVVTEATSISQQVISFFN